MCLIRLYFPHLLIFSHSPIFAKFTYILCNVSRLIHLYLSHFPICFTFTYMYNVMWLRHDTLPICVLNYMCLINGYVSNLPNVFDSPSFVTFPIFFTFTYICHIRQCVTFIILSLISPIVVTFTYIFHIPLYFSHSPIFVALTCIGHIHLYV